MTSLKRWNGTSWEYVGSAPSQVDSGWVIIGSGGAPAFLNGWVNYSAAFGDAAYRKIGNRVQLRGLVKNGTVNTAVFTLPVGFRPTVDLIFATAQGEPQQFARCDITASTGNVTASTLNGWFSLAGISFLVD